MTRKILFAFFISLSILLSSCTQRTPIKPEQPTVVVKDNPTEIPKQPHENTPTTESQPPQKTPDEVPAKTEPPAMPAPAPTAPTPSPKPDPAPNTDPSKLDNTELSWYYSPNSKHQTPGVPQKVKALIGKYSGYYVGSTSSKDIYLTFDEGYENGYTSKILDTLKENNIKAAFFVTKPYINQNPTLIKRMVNEGHIVGNHTSTHPSMPLKTGNIDEFNKEFSDTEKAFKSITGKDMPKYFRPPMGKYSEKSLYLTQKLGYKTVFWSFAHKDWLVDNQPSKEETIKRVLNGAHNGEIMLLHAVSKSNTDALDSIIKTLKSQGYSFKSLETLK